MAFTRFGEERVKLSGFFEVDVISACNFGCKFCYQDGRPAGPPMSFGDAKNILLQIKELAKREGISPRICISGGEPFLNKDAPRIIHLAVTEFGRGSVEVSTNWSVLPRDKEALMAFFEKCGRPSINLSVDREHLKFAKGKPNMHLKEIFAAAKATKVKVRVISVATSYYEEQHFLPKSVLRVVPKKNRRKIISNPKVGRLEFFANESAKSALKRALEKGRVGDNSELPLHTSSAGISPFLGGAKVDLVFATNGKVYLGNIHDALFFPQLSLGSWKRENLAEIVSKNLPFKINMLKGWFNYRKIEKSVKSGRGYINYLSADNPGKLMLFSSAALRRFERLDSKRSGVARRK